MDIISVRFLNKANQERSGREYSYRTNIPVKVGDIVLIPVKNGTAKGQVSRVNIKDSELTFDPRLLKTIEAVGDETDAEN